MTNTFIHGKFSWLRVFIIIAVIIFFIFLFLFSQTHTPRELAKRIKCNANLKQVALGLKQYALDNSESFPSWDSNMEPHQAFGKLYPNYLSAIEVFRCPSSGDTKWDKDTVHIDNADGKPFSQQECEESLSYAYSINRDGDGKGIKGPWTENAPSSLRIVADKYVTHDYTIENHPKHRPLNHKSMDGMFWTDRNILRHGCRNFALLDGSAKIEESIKLLEADPDTEYEKSGHPESDQTGADWWSDPPDKP
jgi:hypothetical protein